MGALPPQTGPLALPALQERVVRVLDLIRPSVQADGGDLQLVRITPEGIVQVRFLGSCHGCPSAPMTLATGIERNLKAHVPEVKGVQAVE